MKKLWKWIVWFLSFIVGILVLSGKKNKRVKEIKSKIKDNEKKVKDIDKSISDTTEKRKNIKKSIKEKETKVKDLKSKKKKIKVKDVSADDAADFLKSYKKKK